MSADVVDKIAENTAKTAKASPLAVMGKRYSIEPAKLLDVLKGTVMRGDGKRVPTNEEVAAFTIVANEYGLNPFTREIHAFVSQSGGVVPIVGIDGWVRLVNSDPRFDGVEFAYVNANDDIGVTCTMHVKGHSKPTIATEWLKECRRNTAPWNTMPRRMLRHRAYMQCARLAFGFSGIYDEDEAVDIVSGGPAAPAETTVKKVETMLSGGTPSKPDAPPAPKPEPITMDQLGEIYQILDSLHPPDDAVEAVLKAVGASCFEELTKDKATVVLVEMAKMGGHADIPF